MSATPSTSRRYWARQLIERQTPTRPIYGSTEWLMLPNDHPDKIAACVVAAECWATAGDTLEDDLRREIKALQIGFKHGEDTAYQEQVDAHRERYGEAPRQLKSFVERRTDQIAAAQPRPGDHPGGMPRPDGVPAPRPPGEWDARFWDGGDSA